MTGQEEHATNVRFDEESSFSQNSQAYLERLEKVDADMAAILQANWPWLVAIVRNGERDSKARTEFNSKVAAALDALVPQVESSDGE